MAERLAKKVLLIGWDAADWKIAAPLMDEGKMPHLERLVSQGVMGNIATLFPVLSPMLWTSIATGKRAHKHGVHGFAEPDPRSGMVRPITNLSRKCKAVWNILQQNGLKSNVVGWWPSYPAEPISGVMVSNHFQEATAAFDKDWPLKSLSVHPPQLAAKLAQFRIHPGEIAEQQVLPFVPRLQDIDLKDRNQLSGLIKILAETATVQAVSTAIMQHEPWDFMGVYFDGIDHFCHGYMRYHPPRLSWVPEKEFEFYKDVINVAYQFHDMMLGAMLTLAGDDTTVILMSDHGFHSDHLRPRELPNEPAGPADEHRGFGIFAMRGPGIKQDELIHGTSLLDITPTILTLFGLPVGCDMDGKPATSAFVQPPEIEWIESWENVQGDAGRHPPEMQIDSVDARESLKQLVALGYIEKPDDDKDKAVAQTVRELQFNLARSYLGARMIPEASSLFAQLWDQFPDEGRFGVKLFECQLQLQQTSAAEATLKRLASEKERYAAEAKDALLKLKEEWKDKKPDELSKEERRKLQRLSRIAAVNPATMAFLRGTLLHAQGRYEESLGDLKQASEVDLHNRPNLYSKMGDCLIGLKRWDEALAQYQQILTIDPVSPDARIGLARAFLGLHQNRQALNEATAAVGMIYHHPIGHYLCGRALRRLKRYKRAIAEFKTAISQNSVFPQAHRHLATVYDLVGKPKRARHHRKLAKLAQERVQAFRSGSPLPDDADIELDAVLTEPIRIGDSLGAHAGKAPGPETVIIVSGLPRSGTSMMMQMLSAGGLPILTDGVRNADSDNPRGYFEYEPAKSRDGGNGWLQNAHGKVVKLVAQLLPGLPPGPDYRILFMERPLAEVVASQRVMIERLNRKGASIPDRRLAATYRRQIESVRKTLEYHGDRVSILGIDYHDALTNPASVAARVNSFLGDVCDQAAMPTAVDPALRRQSL